MVKIIGEVLDLLPELQDTLSLLEVIRETQVCEHREKPVGKKGKEGRKKVSSRR